MSPYHRRGGGQDGNNFVVDFNNTNNIVGKKRLLFGELVDVKKEDFLWGDTEFYQGNYRSQPSRVSVDTGVGIEEPTGNFGLVPSSFGKGKVFGNENVRWGTEKLQKRGEESMSGGVKWGSAKLEKRGEFGSVVCKPSVSMEREEMGSERRLNNNLKWGSAKLEKRPSVLMEREEMGSERRFNDNVKWGSEKLEKRGEFGSVVCKPSVLLEREELGSECRLSNKSYRGFNEKRLYNESRSGKFKNVGIREELEEFGYSPKTKVLRTSALLRVGKTPTKWKDQETLSFKKYDGPSTGSFTHRGSLELPDEKQEQGETESSIDLDVSFKSNALVAKAVVSRSDHVVGSDEMNTPNNNKKRKIVAPLLSGSSPRVTGVREKLSKRRPRFLTKFESCNKPQKGLVRSKDKATGGRIGSAGSIGSQPCRDKNIVPLEKKVRQGELLHVLRLVLRRKKLNINKLSKNVDVASNSDKVLMQSDDQVSVSSIGTLLVIGSQPCAEQVTESHKKSSSVHNKGLTQSKDEVVIDGNGVRDNIDSQPSLIETDVPLGQCDTEKTPLCSTGSFDKKPLSGDSSPQTVDAASVKGLVQSESININSGMETGDITGSQLCLSGTGKIPLSKKFSSDENLFNGDSYNQNLDVASRFDRGLCLTQSRDEVTVAGLGTGDVSGSQSCLNGTTVSVDTTVTENCILKTPVGSDIKLLHGDRSIQKLDAVSGFDNGFCLTDLNDKIASVGIESVDGAGFQPNLNGTFISVETSMTGNSPSKNKVGTSEKQSNSTQKSGAALKANKVLTQLKNEITISGIGIGDSIGSGPCLSGITMPLEANAREKTPLCTTSGFDKKLPNCDSSTSKSDSAFSYTKSLTQAMDEGTISGVGSGSGSGNANDDHPCQNGIATPLDMTMTVKTPLGAEVGSDVICAPKLKKRKRKRKKNKKFIVPDSGLPAPVVTNANVLVTSLPAPVAEVFHGVACRDSSGNGETTGDVCLYPSNNAVNTSLKNRDIVAPLLNTSSFSVSEVVKSDNSLMQSEEKPTVSVIGSTVGLQSDKWKSISLAFEKNNKSYQKAKLLSRPLGSSPRTGKSEMKRLAVEHGGGIIAVSEASMGHNRAEPLKPELRRSRKRSRRSKRKDMEHSLGLSSPPLTETHHESVTASSSGHGADCTWSSGMGLRQSEEQATTSEDRIEIVDMQSVHRVTDLDESVVTKSLLSPPVGFGEIPKVDMKTASDNFSDLSTSRLTETHDGPTTSDLATYFLDASTNCENATRDSEEKNAVSGIEAVDDVDLLSLPGVTAMHGNSAAIESFSNVVATAAHKSRVKKKIKKIKKIKLIKKIKRKRKLIPSFSSLRNCEETGKYVEPKNLLSCNDGIDAALISDEVQKKSEEEVIISSIGNVDAVGNPISLENCLEQRSPMNVVSVRNGVDEDDDISSARPNISSSLFAEELTFPHGHFPMSLAYEGDCNRDSIESKVGEGESHIDLDAAGELGLLGRENCEDLPLQLSEVEKVSFLPLELQISALNERSVGKVTEDDIYGLPVKDEIPFVSTSATPSEEALGTSIINSNEEGSDCVFERLSNTDDQHSLFTTQDSGATADSGVCANSDQTTETEYVISKKTLFSPSVQRHQLTSTSRPKVGEMIGRKIFQSPSVTKVFSGPASFSSSHYNKSTDSSTRTARPRTWHRTGNPLPLSQKVSSLSAGPSERLTMKKIQSTSYIRKGNSLVRKCVPPATSPQVSGGLSTSSVQLNYVGSDESKGSAASDHKANCLDPQNYLRTSIDGGLCKTPDSAYKNSASHTVAFQNHNDVSKDSETQGLLDNGKSQSSKMTGITYVKRKSNQLVASCNTEVDGSSSIAENTQTLHSSVPYDQYYKKNKNQLIRNATSVGSHLKQALSIPNDILNLDSQRASKASFLKGIRNISKRKLDRAFVKSGKTSKFSLVWTLNGEQTHKDTSSLQRHSFYPNLFPWKRATQWRNFKCNSISSKNSFLRIGYSANQRQVCHYPFSKTLLLSRKRDTIYTRSTGGFSLRKSKVLSIGGSNLKWSKSIETRSKKANEEATLAVAAVEKKKREQKGTGRAATIAKRRNNSSRERIFRIGSVRYKMDSSKRTLQRIPADTVFSRENYENLSCAVDIQSGKGTSNSFIPKRLLIDNNEYIRLGNGNQLVRDPKKLVRLLASEKIRWSLHTARLRLARKQQYCQFFTRFGKCNKGDGKCPYIHDPDKIAVCTKFLKGLCSNPSCKLTHKVIPERMPDCSYFLQGLCTNESCPYRHVNVNPNAPVCEGFLRGYCASGNECCKKHSYVCPVFSSTGVCPQGSMCKLHHPKNRNKATKLAKISRTIRGRYFGSKLNDTSDTGIVSSDKRTGEKSEDIFTDDTNELADYISIDVSDEECQNSDYPIGKYTKFYDSEPSDTQSDELHEFIIPVRLL
ncbi:hypothetical protein IFM89_018202 [Coptis chinensis]|uniref:C3H1-type domain-containing protein n=1 Tax=Coptis chinensis TaxID=261450 RepID=A0A835I3A5_9MAGN|nr:hypothetical protein IFM89_018202 [Coptis chinensis]